eukprot:350619_1
MSIPTGLLIQMTILVESDGRKVILVGAESPTSITVVDHRPDQDHPNNQLTRNSKPIKPRKPALKPDPANPPKQFLKPASRPSKQPAHPKLKANQATKASPKARSSQPTKAIPKASVSQS